MRIQNNGHISMSSSLSVSANIDSGSYIISTAGEVYARNGFDVSLRTDPGQMAVCFGNIGSGATPTYLKIGAYASLTFIESNQSRSIYFRTWSGTFGGTKCEWIFGSNFTSYNANNQTTWHTFSDKRIKENIKK
jgi:hypothetical protein